MVDPHGLGHVELLVHLGDGRRETRLHRHESPRHLSAPMTTASAAFSLGIRTALVTGASTGLGRAFAVALARAGADIVAVGRKPPAETAAGVAAAGRRLEFVEADLHEARPEDIVTKAL